VSVAQADEVIIARYGDKSKMSIYDKTPQERGLISTGGFAFCGGFRHCFPPPPGCKSEQPLLSDIVELYFSLTHITVIDVPVAGIDPLFNTLPGFIYRTGKGGLVAAIVLSNVLNK
jgi:hypothetical protein